MQHIQTHDDRAPIAQEPHILAQASELIEGELVKGAPYSGAQLAMELAIALRAGFANAESIFRTRWLPWLQKVAPMELLKTEDGYTELARW